MRVRRMLAGVGVVLVIAPVMIRAQDLEQLGRSEAERMAYDDELQVDGVFHGGVGHYTSCDGDHTIAYGGVTGSARWRMAHGPTWRAAGGIVYSHDTVTDDTGAESVDEGVIGGGVFQVGSDWTYLGFLAGVMLFTDGGSDENDTPILPSAELRLGPMRPFYVRLALADDPSILRTVISGEAVFADADYNLAGGLRLTPAFDAPIFTVRGDAALSKTTSIGVGLGLAPTERHLSWQGELSFTVRMDP